MMDGTQPVFETTTYQYTPLPDSASYTRLLEVNDAYESYQRVECTLSEWPIYEVPVFHAISYTWGAESSTAVIILNGEPMVVRKIA